MYMRYTWIQSVSTCKVFYSQNILLYVLLKLLCKNLFDIQYEIQTDELFTTAILHQKMNLILSLYTNKQWTIY